MKSTIDRPRALDRSPISRRALLASLPALALAPRLWTVRAQAGPTIPVARLHSFGLRVRDVNRSTEFYQGLFGMAIQARQDATVWLRIGRGPQFMSLRPVAPTETPAITHMAYSTPNFDPDRIMAALKAAGIARIDPPGVDSPGLANTMKAWVRTRRGTPEVFFSDANGLIVQLQDPSYCGGSGPLGNVCEPVAAPTGGLLAVKDISHFTVFVSDGAGANAFYQKLFGLGVQAYQGPAAPVIGVGDGIQFVMFAGGGGGRGGGGTAAPAPANIHHACMNLDGFDVPTVQSALERYGIRPRPDAAQGTPPLVHYVSLRMPNRGGADGGTPELYFTDPDGILMQLQDSSYCGGGGVLGNECG